MDAYRDDLAYIHDAGFTGFAQAAAGVLLEYLRKSELGAGLVVDLGCGSGVLATEVTNAGYEVLGIDLSEAMIELACRRTPQAMFRVGSLFQTEVPPCIAVTAIGECFNYLFDPGNTTAALADLLRRICTSLAPGGVLLCDVAEPGRGAGPGASKTHVQGDGWAVLATTEEDGEQRVLTRRITSFRRVGDLYRRDEETHRLRLISRTELLEQLRNLGFHVQPLSSYGPQKFFPGHAGFLARKGE